MTQSERNATRSTVVRKGLISSELTSPGTCSGVASPSRNMTPAMAVPPRSAAKPDDRSPTGMPDEHGSISARQPEGPHQGKDLIGEVRRVEWADGLAVAGAGQVKCKHSVVGAKGHPESGESVGSLKGAGNENHRTTGGSPAAIPGVNPSSIYHLKSGGTPRGGVRSQVVSKACDSRQDQHHQPDRQCSS